MVTVHVHDLCSAVAHFVHKLLWLNNHQVHIKRLLAQLLNIFYHWESKRNVRHEYAIHHIEVQHLRLALVYHLYVARQVAKVGVQ